MAITEANLVNPAETLAQKVRILDALAGACMQLSNNIDAGQLPESWACFARDWCEAESIDETSTKHVINILYDIDRDVSVFAFEGTE